LTAMRPVRALVVDDYPDVAEALARVLQSVGCSATFVVDSVKTMDAAAALAAEIVFLDIAMPGINGYQLARMLRQEYGDAVFLVAMSIHASDEHEHMARDAGFDARVQKPLDMKVVQGILSTVLAHRPKKGTAG
jgi:CheY-like chemotaxis protein